MPPVASDNHPGRIASMDTPSASRNIAWRRPSSTPAGRYRPARYGGCDCDRIEWLIYEEEYLAVKVLGFEYNGVSLLAPTIFNFGNQEQQDFFLPRWRGTHLGPGWSEPGGSDPQASRPRSSTVTTSSSTDRRPGARKAFADQFCIVRTDPEAERHQGLTHLLVPAETRGWNGVDRRLDGESLAELFDDARVSAEHVLGGVGQDGRRWPPPAPNEASALSWSVRRRRNAFGRWSSTSPTLTACGTKWSTHGSRRRPIDGTHQMAGDLMGAEIGPEASRARSSVRTRPNPPRPFG